MLLGADETHNWIESTGANMWRSTGDIFDSYAKIRELIMLQYKILPFGSGGCFNDMDMLVTGMHGKGHVGLSGCTFEEYKLHMSVWSILASPLMIGCDIRNMDDETVALLMNKEMIAINQDKRGNRAYIANENDVLNTDWGSLRPVFCRLLENGDLAVCLVNLSDNAERLYALADQMGVTANCGKKLVARDVWSGEEIPMDNDCLLVENMPAHSARLFRVSFR